MGSSGSKNLSARETVQSRDEVSEPSTGSRQDKVSVSGTDSEGVNDEESFYSWSALSSDLDKAGQGRTFQVVPPSSAKVPPKAEDESSSVASTVAMDGSGNNVEKLGIQLQQQLHVEEGAWEERQSNSQGSGFQPPKAPATLTPAESPANPSWETQRTSHGESDGSQHPVRMSTGTSSARSSFALEQADMFANRKSIEAFQKAYCQQQGRGLSIHRNTAAISEEDTMDGHNDVDFSRKHGRDIEILMGMGLPKDLCKDAWMLCILPPETPAPVTMLSKLWNEEESAAECRMLSLAKLGVLKVAHLPDGNIWGLPQEDFIQEIQKRLSNESCLASFHGRLVEGYARDAWAHANISCEAPKLLIRDNKILFTLLLSHLQDDGYIVINLMYHLVGARLDNVVRALLMSPEWLEKKLLLSGAAAVISDFRRYLMIYRDKDIKLILEALQLSVGALKNNMIPGLLKSQLAGRLMMAPLQSRQPWMTSRGNSDSNNIVALPILNPCLDQAGGLQRLCLKGHRGPVNKLALLPSGSEAISASGDGTIRVWDLEIGSCIMSIDAHDGPITGFGVTSDMSLVVTSSDDGMVRAFGLEEGSCLRTFGIPNCPIKHISLDPFGRFIVTADTRGKLCLWDLVSATAIHESAVGSQVSHMALSSCTKYVVVGTSDGDIYGVEIESWKLVCSLRGHSAPISGLIASHNLGRIISGSMDGDIRVWKRDGTPLLKNTCDSAVTSLHVTKSFDRAVCGYDDGKAMVWDLKSGNCLKVLDGHNGPITCTSMSHKEETIITGSVDGTSIAWSTDSGEIMRVLEGHSSSILCLELSTKGRFALTGSEDGTLRVWDFTAVNSHIPHWHAGNIRDLCCGMKGIAVTAGDDCVARIWDSTVGEFLGEFRKHSVSIRWCIGSKDGSKILTASPNREIHVWDIESRESLYGLPASAGSRVKSLSASEDLTLAVVCLFDSSVSLWNLQKGECVWEIQKKGHLHGSHGHLSAVNSVILTDDGKHVITASKDTTTRIWDVESRTCRYVLKEHKDSVVGLEFEPCQGILLTYALDHSLVTWDFETGEKLSRAKFKKPITRAAISKSGIIAVALSDGSINIISPETGSVKESRMHMDTVTALVFSDDGNFLFTSSTDCSLKMVDLTKEYIRGVFIGDCPISSVTLQKDSGHIIAGTDRGVVIFLDASALLPLQSGNT